MSTIPNLLVLSAGGFGHAAVPLFKQSARPLGDLPRSGRWLVIFRGSETAPGAFRSKVKRVVEEATAARRGWATQVDVGVGSIVNWREQMRDTRVRLSPRGCGRTAYHLMETVQMGVVHLHVFLDGDRHGCPIPMCSNTWALHPTCRACLVSWRTFRRLASSASPAAGPSPY